MTIEQKKERLYRYQNSLRKQTVLLSQIEDAKEYATAIQATPGGVRTASTGTYSDRVGFAVQRIDELQRKYLTEVEHGYQIHNEIQTAIEALPDIMQTMAIYYRYLCGMKVDYVSVKLERSTTTVAKLLSTALDALEIPQHDALNGSQSKE